MKDDIKEGDLFYFYHPQIKLEGIRRCHKADKENLYLNDTGAYIERKFSKKIIINK